MPNNDTFWFRLDNTFIASFNEADFIDFDWQDYAKFDESLEIKLKARNVTYEMNGQEDFKEYSEIPCRFVHSRGDAIALSPRGWRPLAFIPNGAIVFFDKNAFATIKRHIDKAGNPQPDSIGVVVDFFQNRKITIDPKPILLEGNNRFDKKLPSLDEMREELEFFTNKMKDRVPNLTVKTTASSLPQLHKASSIFYQGLEAIIKFIDSVYLRMASGVKFQKNLECFKEILGLAKEARVKNIHLIFAAIVFKAVTSEPLNPIFKLLKFNKPNFIAEGHSFNGALDIYSLILFLSEIRNHGDSVFFVTADKDLIHLWNDMNPFMMVNDQPGVLHFDIMYFLPGIGDDEIDDLQSLLKMEPAFL